MTTTRRAAARPLPTSPFSYQRDERPVPDYCVGDRVTHDHYGLGRVTTLHGDAYVTVSVGSEVIRFARASRALIKV